MKAKETWKPVTISGFTGILMGAGAMYAAQKYEMNDAAPVAESSEEQQMKEMVVDDNLSFREAFDTARAELGSGGVFHWHGKIFNTFTADEWQAMSNEDKELFAQQIKPEVSPADIDTNQIAEIAPGNNDVQVAENITWNESEPVQIVEEDVAVAAVHVEEQQTTDSEDNDVRIVGYGDIDLANGNSVTIEELEINGQRVAVIDVDQDGVGDIAMSDLNHNNRADEGEIIDLHTGDVLSFDNQVSVEDIDAPIDIMPA